MCVTTASTTLEGIIVYPKLTTGHVLQVSITFAGIDLDSYMYVEKVTVRVSNVLPKETK